MDEALRDAYPEPLSEGEALSAHRVKLFIALAVLVGAFGYLAFIAFESATRYYYTVGELQQLGPSEDSRAVRVTGKLVPDSFVREKGSTLARFSLTDGDATIPATHDGVLPDLFFNEHSDVILEGTYDSDGTFRSQLVTVKCPSKYVAAG